MPNTATSSRSDARVDMPEPLRADVRLLGELLGERPDLTSLVLDEHARTIEWVLSVTGHDRLLENRPVLARAVALRNPYVDALPHLQLRALRALRAGGSDSDVERLQRLLLLTVNGVAAGLQNTD